MKQVYYSFLLIGTLFLITKTGNTQIEWGVTGGLNLSTLDYTSGINFDDLSFGDLNEEAQLAYSDLDNSKSKLGYNFGVYAMHDIGVLSFNPSLLYSTAGYKTNDYSINLGYLSAPLLFGFNPIDILHVQIGPQFGYNISSKINPTDRESYSVSNYNKLDYGAVIGAMIDVGKYGNLSARYIFGLGNVTDPIPSGTEELKFQNRVFQINLSVPIQRSRSDN